MSGLDLLPLLADIVGLVAFGAAIYYLWVRKETRWPAIIQVGITLLLLGVAVYYAGKRLEQVKKANEKAQASNEEIVFVIRAIREELREFITGYRDHAFGIAATADQITRLQEKVSILDELAGRDVRPELKKEMEGLRNSIASLVKQVQSDSRNVPPQGASWPEPRREGAPSPQVPGATPEPHQRESSSQATDNTPRQAAIAGGATLTVPGEASAECARRLRLVRDRCATALATAAGARPGRSSEGRSISQALARNIASQSGAALEALTSGGIVGTVLSREKLSESFSWSSESSAGTFSFPTSTKVTLPVDLDPNLESKSLQDLIGCPGDRNAGFCAEVITAVGEMRSLAGSFPAEWRLDANGGLLASVSALDTVTSWLERVRDLSESFLALIGRIAAKRSP